MSKFASLMNWLTAYNAIVTLSGHFRIAADTVRTNPYDAETHDYAVAQLNEQIVKIFSPLPDLPDDNRERLERDNLDLDIKRGRRMAKWIEKVGPQVTLSYDERIYELYLKTISTAAEATMHGRAPVSNRILSSCYAGLLPVTASCAQVSAARPKDALAIYMGELTRVWTAAACYPESKEGMAQELKDQINLTNSRGFWGEEENPRFGHHRTAILQLIRT